MNPLARALVVDHRAVAPVVTRALHTHVLGQPGTGKSRALESWALQDILAGRGVAVIDPHGDLFEHLVNRLATYPGLAQRVILVDPCDPDWVTGIDPLEAVPGLPLERQAQFLTDIIVKIWRLDAATSPRLIRLLSNCFLALADLGLKLIDLPRFLLDTPFREGQLSHLRNEAARLYFNAEFPDSQGAINQWVTPVLNKMGGLLFDPEMRLMLAGRATLNFREVLDQQQVLLVHLPKGILGEGSSALLGAFLVAQLQKAALGRADSQHRPPFHLYLDEFQNYTTDNIQDILSESRKYGLALTLAHQYLDQLAPELRYAVLSTTGTLCCFRVGYSDAVQLVRDIFPSADFRSRSQLEIQFRHPGRWPVITGETRNDPMGWEGLAHQLSNLPFRQFWVKRRGVPVPALLRTLDTQEPKQNAEFREQVLRFRKLCGEHFGKPKDLLRRQLYPDRAANTPKAHEAVFWGK